MEKKDLTKTILKIGILVILIAVMIFLFIKYSSFIMKMVPHSLKDLGNFKDYILSFKALGVLIYICFQILHVIIIFIPGEFVQIAGGFIYGTFFGTLYTFIGIFLGINLVFFATRIFGYSLIKFFIPKDKLEKYNYLINNPRAEIIMFFLFLIPGIPKDALTYIAGLTPVKPLRFILLCSVARFPGIFFSAYIGSNLESRNYLMVIIISIIAVILFILGVIFQEKIVNFIHNIKERIKSGNKKKENT
jgi:uncharacterized membrane protein YdjX (TVP38/TMEM64 family)